MRPLDFHLIGFESREAASAAADRVTRLIDDICATLGFGLLGLEGITIAHNYRAALASLDRGLTIENVLTPTHDGVSRGSAMAPLVLREGKVLSHIMLSAGVLDMLDEEPMDGISGKYVIAHELAHVEDHDARDEILPNTLLRPVDKARDAAVLFSVAEKIWTEYVACCLSAPIYPDQARLFESNVVNVLKPAKQLIISAIVKLHLDKDWRAAYETVYGISSRVLRHTAYLVGHAAGLDKPIKEIAPVAWAVLESNGWLFPWIDKLENTLADMLASFHQWTGMEAFGPLEEIVRGVLADCGVSLSVAQGRSLHVEISPAEVWTAS